MATAAEKLQKLKNLRNPDQVTEDVLNYLASRIETVDIEQPMPMKGYDYFTQQDIEEIANVVRHMVRDGVDGEKGEKGDSIVGPQGPAGRQGPRGEDGKSIVGPPGKNGKDGISPTIEAIITELRKKPIEYKDIKDAPNPKDLQNLIAFLKAGGFRGGGDTVIAGSGISISSSVTGAKTITALGNTALSKTLTYNGDGSLHTVTDSSGSKTFSYTNGVLTSIAGTGAYPNEAFSYTDGVLTSITVS